MHWGTRRKTERALLGDSIVGTDDNFRKHDQKDLSISPMSRLGQDVTARDPAIAAPGPSAQDPGAGQVP